MKSGELKTFFIRSSIAAVIAVVALGPNLPTFLATLEYNKTTMRGGNSELTINHDAAKPFLFYRLDGCYATPVEFNRTANSISS